MKLRLRAVQARRWMCLGMLALVLAGCRSHLPAAQNEVTAWVDLAAGARRGQTFVAPEDGLARLAVAVQGDAAAAPQAALTLRLRSAPDAAVELARVTVPLAQRAADDFLTFAFPPLPASSGQRYYFELEGAGAGRLQLGQGSAVSYPQGAAYLNGVPEEAQLAFRLGFDRPARLLGFLRRDLAAWLLQVGAFGLLFNLPGLGLLLWLAPASRRWRWSDLLAVSAGLGLALPPVGLLLARLLGLKIAPQAVWLLPLGGAAAVLFALRRQPEAAPPDAPPARPRGDLAELTLLGALALIILGRLAAARGVVAPMWGDSVQHTIMTQRLLESGGLFTSWEPYAPYATLSVQFGFPAQAAAFAAVSGLDSLAAVTVFAQLLNAAAALLLYPLARLAAGDRPWAGTAAVIVGGALSPMPAFYVNWGRFAQLGGSALLTLSLFWLMAVVADLRRDRPPEPARRWLGYALLGGLSLAGMTLTYYRTPFFFAAFGLLFLAAELLPRWRGVGRLWAAGMARLALLGGIGLLIFALWLPDLLGANLSTFVEGGMANAPAQAVVWADLQVWRELLSFLPLPLLGLAAVCSLLALWRRQWLVAALPLWMLLPTLYLVGQMWRWPGANMLQSFAILISLYLPAALLIGWGWSEAAVWLAQRGGRFGLPAAALGLLLLTIWGLGAQARQVQPRFFALLTEPDRAAARWIAAHTPADSLFLVEAYTIWSGGSLVGSDGGWWLPLLAGRRTLIPPQYALISERPEPPTFSAQVIALVGQLEREPLPQTASRQALCAAGVTHLYVGQGRGAVGSGAHPLFTPEALQPDPAFELIYRQDRTAVYALHCAEQP